LLLGAGAALAAAPATATAQSVDIRTPHQGGRPLQLDFHAGFTWSGVGFASGVRFGIPIVDNGFIDSLNNAVYLNFGADFYWVRWRFRGGPGNDDWEYSYGFGFPVTLHWEFYFNESWSAFAELGGQLFLHPRWLQGEGFDVYDWGYWFIGAVGGHWHINDVFLLTVRVGSPYIAAGITLQLG